MSATPNEAFNALGVSHSVTFLCGASAGLLGGPSASPYPTTGCFNVTASVVDETAGSAAIFTSVICGGRSVDVGSSTNCGTVYDPICAAGATTVGLSNSCSPCPVGFTFAGGVCQEPPIGLACPGGTTPSPAPPAAPTYCIGPAPSTTVGDQNRVVVTLNSGAPHSFQIEFTGFVGTTASGGCPAGTTLNPNVQLSRAGVEPVITGPACAFDLRVEKKYIEGTGLQIIPLGACGGSATLDLGLPVGTPCFFTVKATGVVVLKTGVNCSNGTEPENGSSAELAGFPAGSVYTCDGSTLTVTNVPVPGIPITLHAINGYFNPTCIPRSRFQTPTPVASPTATEVGGPFPTDTPTTTPTPTPTAIFATPTSSIPTPTPTALPLEPSLCGPPGTTSTTVVTNSQGTLGGTGTEIEYNALATPPYLAVPGFETITGRFLQDLFPVPGVQMFSTFHLPDGDVFCDSGFTDATGTATCTQLITSGTPSVPINVDAHFVYNCAEYSTTTSFTPLAPGQIPPPVVPTPVPFTRAAAPAGICVTRIGLGDLIISASFVSTINTQPDLHSPQFTLGSFRPPTPTPTSTETPVPTPGPTQIPTETPVPTQTETPSAPTATETPTEAPTNTPVPSPTIPPPPTGTPTPPPALKFHLDSAKVTKQVTKDTCATTGLDVLVHGQQVCLIMYYTISSMPGSVNRVTTYEIKDASGRSVYKVTFRGSEPVPGTFPARLARFTPYTVPNDLPFGVYQFRGTLTLGGRSQTRVWQFAVVRPTVYTTIAQYLGVTIGTSVGVG